MNTEVYREPTSPAQLQQEIDDTFTFNAPLSPEHAATCQQVQNACKTLADLIVQAVPEGKERTICVNNILSCALFARHGITRRQVVLMVASPLPDEGPVASSAAPESTSPASPSTSESAAT